jgi:Peptidase family M48
MHQAARRRSVRLVFGPRLKGPPPARIRCFSYLAKFCQLVIIGSSVVPFLASCGAQFNRRYDADNRMVFREPGSGVVPIRGEGGPLLNDALVSPEIAKGVKENGTPDAIDVHQVGLYTQVAMFYAQPAHTLWYKGTPGIYTINFRQVSGSQVVPRSVRRLGFGEGPMPPPWPVTTSMTEAEIFGLPELPKLLRPAAPEDAAQLYVTISGNIRTQIVEVQSGDLFDRASKAFAKLDPSSRLPGWKWRLVLFHSPDYIAFGVPDGTLFVSDGLVNQLNSDELTALLAHLLGHEAYGHDRDFWTEAGLIKRTAAIAGLTVMAAAAIFVTCSVPSNVCLAPTLLPADTSSPQNASVTVHSPYSRNQEIEANLIAIKYLHEIGIPPDTLFDTLVKIKSSPLGAVHHAGVSASDLGKMLDTGMIQTEYPGSPTSAE